MQDVPSLSGGMYTRFEAEGHPETWDPTRLVRQNAVSPDAFAALGVPILEGRAFRRGDGRTGEALAVVNATAARTLWGDESPVGRRLRRGGDEPGPWMTVVGVVGAVHQRSAGREPDPEVFVPWGERAPGRVRLVVEAAADPAPLFPALRALVTELDPALPVDRVVSLRETVDATLAEPRFDAALLLAFAVLTLVLAAVGIYGSVAYAVSQETRPLAVRRALGAARRSLAARVLGRGAALVGLGLALGLAGSAAAGRLLESMLFGLTPADPPTLAAAAALLAAVSVLACAAPARRAARVEPAVILRGE